MPCPTCSRCRSLVLAGESVLQAQHGWLWRRWRAAGKAGRLLLCRDCAEALVDWLRDREALDVLSALPSAATV